MSEKERLNKDVWQGHGKEDDLLADMPREKYVFIP